MLSHFIGFYTRPKSEWRIVEHKSVLSTLIDLCIVSIIPALMFYFSCIQYGWGLSNSPSIASHYKIVAMSLSLYVAIIFGVTMLAVVINEFTRYVDTPTGINKSYSLATYAATPLMLATISMLYPEVWFVTTVGFISLVYSMYLLFSGVPILMPIPKEVSFVYASSVVACALSIVTIAGAASTVLWSLSAVTFS